MWRQFLESLCHDESSFVTLTYRDECLPAGGNLEYEVVSRWLDRFRKTIAPRRFRYFLVGEYGSNSLRPHYHISLFGLSGTTVLECFGRIRRVDEIIDTTWGLGFTYVAEFNELTAQYVAGYVVKKYTDKENERLQGRVPEFATMSRRPGLGAGAMEHIAKTISASEWRKLLVDGEKDVPRVLRVGRRTIPLGRYLLGKLREAVGLSPEQIEKIRRDAYFINSVEMQTLFKDAFGDKTVLTAREAYLKSTRQKIRQLEAREKLKGKGFKL